ncbi:MAG: 16S rRNA processing protein RimM [Bacilli bacterium]|nr:16S rRNA processing protein RimM [Bacilli bacterium]
MELVNIGRIVNTHGIKGELRILSDFRYKDKVFVKGVKLYVGKKKEEFVINTYRHHKVFDMVTFDGYTNINEVLYLKGLNVYVDIDQIDLGNEIYPEKLIGYEVYFENESIGNVTEVLNEPASFVLRINEKILIPYVDNFIDKIEDNKIYVKNVRGLL